MAIIGGRIEKKTDKNFTHRITVENEKGERSSFHFFTIRSARNWLREHPEANAIELVNTKENITLPLYIAHMAAE